MKTGTKSNLKPVMAAQVETPLQTVGGEVADAQTGLERVLGMLNVLLFCSEAMTAEEPGYEHRDVAQLLNLVRDQLQEVDSELDAIVERCMERKL